MWPVVNQGGRPGLRVTLTGAARGHADPAAARSVLRGVSVAVWRPRLRDGHRVLRLDHEELHADYLPWLWEQSERRS